MANDPSPILLDVLAIQCKQIANAIEAIRWQIRRHMVAGSVPAHLAVALQQQASDAEALVYCIRDGIRRSVPALLTEAEEAREACDRG